MEAKLTNPASEFVERRSDAAQRRVGGEPWLELIERARSRPWWKVEFAGTLRERYEVESADNRAASLRILFFIYILLCGLAPLQDLSLAPGHLIECLIYRYGLMVPCFLLGAIFSVRAFPLWLRAMAGYLPIMLVAVIGAYFSSGLPLMLSERYFHGVMLVIIGSNLVMSQHFRHALLMTAVGVTAVLYFHPHWPVQPYFIPMFLVPCILCCISLLLRLRQDRLEQRSWLAEFQNQIQKNQLEALANVDALTGISNRRFLDESLRRMWQAAESSHQALSLVMMDIDHFKELNDAAGHLEGDNCLALLSFALQGQVRIGVDVLARYGGDEFVLIVPEADEDTAVRVADRLRQVVQDLKIGSDHDCVPLTLTMGVACYHPRRSKLDEWIKVDGMNTSMDLLRAADTALYRAKERGGNCVEFAG